MGAMAVFRILAGRASLDKLPHYFAVPMGAFLGAAIGYFASMPGASTRSIVLVIGAFAAAAAFGTLAPRPVRQGETAPPAPTPDPTLDANNDSLCD